jgi:glutaconate CoA-transferase subunit B
MNRTDASDLMAIVLGREITDNSVIAAGAFTPLSLAAAVWAKAGHAPGAVLFPISFNAVRVDDCFPLSYSFMEAMCMTAGMAYPMIDIFDVGGRHGIDFEAVSPLQIDGVGNINLSVVGGTYEKPLFRGPGAAGLDALCLMEQKLVVYCPHHTPRVLVDEVDFVTGTGNEPGRRRDGGAGGVGLIVTELCVMDFDDAGRCQVRSLHPGVAMAEVVERTGFALDPHATVPTTPAPTGDELALLELVDPLRTRDIEMMTGAERRAAMPQLLKDELAWFEAHLAAGPG